MTELLTITDLAVALPKGGDRTHAVRGVSLGLKPGETLCVVGESGSGKSVTAAAVMGLLPEDVSITQGSISFEGQELAGLSEAGYRQIRGARIGMIFQEPMSALNPLIPIGKQIAEMISTHRRLDNKALQAMVMGLLADVQIPDPGRAYRAYPHQLSGGQRQRAMIAMALALEPALLIADEPTTALDVTTQAQILTLIRQMQARKGTAVLFITHDFGVVAEIAHRVAVMRQGALVEIGPAQQVLTAPQDEYTKSLIAAVPGLIPPAAKPSPAAAAPAILTVSHLSKAYRSGGIFSRRAPTYAVKDVSLSLARGRTLGVVGESGSGKSTLARNIMRLLTPDSGSIIIDGTDIARLSRRQMRAKTADVQMVFQDPFSSLNPRRKVGEQVMQGPMLHGVSRLEAAERAAKLFERVGLPAAALDRFPHEFSGGQRQRVGLARALALKPKLLVADEPVSALDVSVQAQVLALLAGLKTELDLSLLFITHDLRVAAQICDDIAVMRYGEVVEYGPTAAVFAAPQHDYTRALLGAVPGRDWQNARQSLRQDTAERLAHV